VPVRTDDDAPVASPVPLAANLHKLYVLFGNAVGPGDGGLPGAGGGDAGGGGGGGGMRAGVLVYNTADLKASPLPLDETGCMPGCSAVDGTTQDLIVGRPDAMYFYSEEEGRKGALGFEVKQCLCCLSGSSILAASIDDQSQRTIVNVYDLKNKFVAFHLMLASDQRVMGLLAEGGVAYVVTTQGPVFRLREKDITAKLKLLVDDMKLYGVAIKLAYSSNYDVAKIMEIYKLYGNYLYDKKRAYDAAIQQYCHTIGYLDPSYVISRFLDAQRIKNLTTYLEALHKAGHATADLTTFLLNCYTKLKDVEKLDRFINPERAAQRAEARRHPPSPDPASASGGMDGSDYEPPDAGPVSIIGARRKGSGEGDEAEGGVNFDIQTAIGVLKSAGYSEHALELARKCKAHEWYLRIQLEKANPSYRDALQYISSLPFEAAEQHLRTYGKKLMDHMPEETTGFIMALCTGRFRPILPQPTAEGEGGASGAEAGAGSSTGSGRAVLPEPLPPEAGQRAQAENFVHLFVDHPSWLRTFLECVMKEPGLVVSPSVANTLLELLVQEWETTMLAARSEEIDRIRRQKEADIMNFLDVHYGRYDDDHALVLVQMHKFKQGQLFLYDKMRNVDLVLDYYIAEKDTASVLNRMSRKENKKNPDLWIKVLTYVVDIAKPPTTAGKEGEDGDGDDDDEDEDEDVWEDTIRVLQMIEKEQVLPPLMVIDILSRNDDIPLFVVKEYVSKLLKEAYADVNGSQSRIDSLKQSTAEMRAEVDSLKTTARVFQGTKCNGCPRQLEPPAVHFLCMHSYHLDQNCLDNESECNECAAEHRKYEGIKKRQVGPGATGLLALGSRRAGPHGVVFRVQSEKAVAHEQFFSELEEQGFAAVGLGMRCCSASPLPGAQPGLWSSGGFILRQRGHQMRSVARRGCGLYQ
jgi:vacuolar protein sorting-associated protein 11